MEKDKDFSVYEVPMSLVENQLDELIVDSLGLPAGTLKLEKWRELLHNLRNPEHEISIALVGKYAQHRDAYKSVYEALDHAGRFQGLAHHTADHAEAVASFFEKRAPAVSPCGRRTAPKVSRTIRQAEL